jgi:hypothetical protein
MKDHETLHCNVKFHKISLQQMNAKKAIKIPSIHLLDLLFQSNCRVCSLTIWNMHKHNALCLRYQHFTFFFVIYI